MNSMLIKFIQRKLKLTGGDVAGDWYRVKCPFHADNDPSFGVELKSPYRFNCFGCGAGGDIVSLTSRILDVPITNARRMVLDLRVQDLSSLSDEWVAWESEFVPLHPSHMAFYQAQLADSRPAVKYLRRRCISLELAQSFGLGYCGNRRSIVVPLREPYSGQLGGLFFRGILPGSGFKHIEGGKRRLVFASGNYKTASAVIVTEGWADAIRAHQYAQLLDLGDAAVISLQQARATPYIKRFLLDYSTIIWGLDRDKAGVIGLTKNQIGVKARQYVLEFNGKDVGSSDVFKVAPIMELSLPPLPQHLR